ncbi:SDR family oxidoreductase [Frankia sp. CNm7]|uniref:SDR family oxidoreductase n=1 Tax=Frankia nepalensis TaxID=1836974 RepID=A0A937R9A1_9ACTN|nr:SDR family oxidoreductase [Frankia nepalensis]MBL7501626.1 SDR family oxidoreductase [Frankia nepalensis]MBL7514323.1 SDR family oxidoreductase [Frankia nepalensis]MBL7517852.1 SDR family oxidoreductase [Frankia nepalensis]MBL7628038.1 SDR family oxidoreductase [Frankia nepalensis]
MSLFDAFRYDGKRVLVVGGATGMGAAAAQIAVAAGAEVVVLDIAEITVPGVKGTHVDLRDTASIDAALEAVGGPVHAVLCCAGVADGDPGIEKVNFLGHRYLLEKLLAADALPRGSAIGFISSAAGLGWEKNLPALREYLAISDIDEASAWALEHNNATYMWSKQAVCAYVATQAMPLLTRGIRINAICPGPTDTPLARAHSETWLGFGAGYRAEVGIEAATPLEQGYPLVFLCSDAAAGISGITLITDAGHFAAGNTEVFPADTPAVRFLLGK